MATSKKHDAAVEQVLALLRAGYGRQHPKAKIEAYRYNPASIRVRIVDPDLAGYDRVDRQEMVWPLIESLPEEVRSDLSVLLLVTPEEKKHSMMSREFDEPARSWL